MSAAATSKLPADPALGAGQLLVRLGLALLAIGVPCASVGSRRLLFTLMPLGTALVLAGALLAPSPDLRRQWRAFLLTPTSYTALFLLAWTGLSLIWTPYGVTGSERFFKVVGTAVLAAVAIACLPSRTKTSNLYLFPIGAGAAAVAAILVSLLVPPGSPLRATDLDSSTLDRAVISLVMLAWPAIGALAVRERWASAGALAVAVSATAITVWNPVGMAALALGAIVFALAVSRPRITGQVLAVLSCLLFWGGPLIGLGLGLVARHLHGGAGGLPAMFATWGQIVAEQGPRLITGHGLDAMSRGLSTSFLPPTTPRTVLFEVWYDLGIIGAVASGLLTARAFLAASRATAPLAPFLIASLVSGLMVAISGVSTAQLWWITLVSVVGVAFGVVVRGQYRTERPKVQQGGVAAGESRRGVRLRPVA